MLAGRGGVRGMRVAAGVLGLTDGEHVFAVRAVDEAGNVDACPALFTWRVDTLAPETSIDSGPDALTSSIDASFAFRRTSRPRSSARSTGAVRTVQLAARVRAPGGWRAQLRGARNRQGGERGRVARELGVAGRHGRAGDVDHVRCPARSPRARAPPRIHVGRARLVRVLTRRGGVRCVRVAAGVRRAWRTASTPSTCAPSTRRGTWTRRRRAWLAGRHGGAGDGDRSGTGSASASAAALFAFSANEPRRSSARSTARRLRRARRHWCSSGWPTESTSSRFVRSTRRRTWTSHRRATAGGWTPPRRRRRSTPGRPRARRLGRHVHVLPERLNSVRVLARRRSVRGCSSPQAYVGLADGGHRFEVRAVDEAGNVDASPASFGWRVDTAAPDTVIDSGPPASTSDAAATFTFSSEPGGVFECSLDGAAFAACASPRAYAGLARGAHLFQVRATDADGNTDASPATYAWTVVPPPDVTRARDDDRQRPAGGDREHRGELRVLGERGWLELRVLAG